jgi:hypothetical protein
MPVWIDMRWLTGEDAVPLIKSKSKEAVGKNIEAETDAGKPRKQAIAIALETQRRAKGKKRKAK